MTFGRWLLVHSFSIFLVILLLLGYLYRDELQLEQAYQQLLNLDTPEVLKEAATDPEEKTRPQKAEKEVPVSKSPADSNTASSETSVEPKLQDMIEPKPTVSEVIIEQDALLFRARQSYWNKDYETAIRSYQQLIQKERDNADYLGELGNIYYALNDFPNASMHFYQAALVLIRQNNIEQARSLVSPVTAMNRELGDKLRQKLRQ